MDVVSIYLAIVAICLVVVCLRQASSRRRRLNDLPPPLETGYNPVLGHLLFLSKLASSRSQSVIGGLLDACKTSRHAAVTLYPGPPILVKPIIVVLEPKEARLVAVKGLVSSQLRSGVMLATGGMPVIGILPVQQARKHIRIAGNALLRPHKIDHCCGVMRKYLLEMFHSGQFEQSGGVFEEGRDDFEVLVQKVLFEYVLGIDVSLNTVNAHGRLFHEFRQHFLSWLDIFMSVLMWPFPRWTYMLFNPVKYWKLTRSSRCMREQWMMPIIEEREADIASGVVSGEDGLSTMMGAGQDTTSSSSDRAPLVFEDRETLCNEALGFLLAGDATSGTFLWTIYHLANNPDIQEKIYSEVTSIIGAVPGPDQPDMAALKAIPYLDAFLNEVNRLTPVNRTVIRNMEEEQRIVGGYVIPTGVEVHAAVYPNHVSDEYYDAATEFRPQRWLDHPSTGTSKEVDHGLIYAPFGYGSRRCFGRTLARAFLKTGLALIVQSYHIEAIELTPHDHSVLVGMVQVPVKMKVRFVPRHID